MITFSRNLSRKLTSSLKILKQESIRRNLQTVSVNQSPAVSAKLKPASDQFPNIEFDYESLGTSRRKMEVDGMLLNWEIVGNGEHVVLMLPGTLGTIQSDFGPIFPKMDLEKYTLVSWDPPGYGRSRPPSREYLREHQRTDGHLAVRLMEKLGFDKFSLMGWSNGGTSAYLIAADFPSKVNRLVTMGAFAFPDLQIVNAAKSLLDFDNWHPKMLEPLLTIYGREYLHQTLQRWHDEISDVYHNDGFVRITKSASKVQCPTLIFHGGQDPMSGINQAEYLKLSIRNSTLCILPKAAHNMHLRYTDEFLGIATQFLESE